MASYLNVSFRQGILEIPFQSVDETASARLRNLIALEQCRRDVGDHFTSYCAVMESIIYTAGDVAVLRSRGILESRLGSDTEVANFYHSLCKGTYLNYRTHYNAVLLKEVIAFCEFAPHKWRASLAYEFFNNPWALVSASAGFFLLAFTAVQSYFTVFPRK